MTTPVIIDAIAVAVLALFGILGAWKGLLRTLAGLLVVVLSLAGAGVIASALSAPAAKLIAPVIEKRIEARLDEAIQEQLPERGQAETLPLAELLDLLGVDQARRDALADRAEQSVRDTGASLAAALDASLPAMRLQVERLVEKGLVAFDSSCDGVRLEPAGAQRLSGVLSHEAVERVRDAVVSPWACDARRAEAFDELMSLLDYVFDGGEEAPALAPVRLGAASRPSALAALYALLARLFSYPEHRQAEEHTSLELLDRVRGLLAGLGLGEGLPVDLATRFETWAAASPTTRARDLRAEFTRLFYSYPRLVSLVGSRWVVQGRTEFSRAHGERAAVGLEYRKLGLKNRPGNHDPFDALVSELDFLSYVTSLEARAFEGGDAGSAREWERLRLDFCTHHFGELARGVARAITQHSDNAFLALYAWLLDLVADGAA